MDNNSDRGFDESYHRHVQDEQLPPSDYEVETSDDRMNGDTGGVQMKQSVEHSHSSSSKSSPRKLFVGGISWKTTEETFLNYFRKFGEVVASVIMRDRTTGNPKGYGFVTFADSTVADKVLEEEHVIDDQMVDIINEFVDMGRAVHRGDKDTDVKGVPDTRTIFVGGLPPLLEEDELKNYFSVYGVIIKHQIIYDHHTGESRGFGFITFKTEDSVDRLLSERKVHELCCKQVEIRRGESPSRGRDNSFRSNVASGKYDQEDRYGGKVHEDYNLYSGYGGYGGYGGVGVYTGNSMVNAAGFYGYGGGYGYGYGPYGYGGQMFNLGYGAGVAAATAYGGGNAHGNGNSGSSSGRGNGTNDSGPARYHS